MEVSNSDKKESETKMTLIEAMKEDTGAIAEINSLVYVVQSGQADESNNFLDFVLTIQDGGMPPHYTKFYESISAMEAKEDIAGLDWEALVDDEEVEDEESDYDE